jgi:hypothetical protein
MRNWQVRLVYSRNLGAGDDELAATLSEVSRDLTEYRASVSGGADGLTAAEYTIRAAPRAGRVLRAANDAACRPGRRRRDEG